MANLKRNLALIVLCQLAGYVIGQQPPNLVSFGDFMEFDVGLHKACENAAGGPNTTWGIISSFSDCTFNLGTTQPRDNFEGMAAICENREKYMECWDKMKGEVLKKCGNDKEPMLPAVYRVSVNSLCGSDNGKTKIETLKQALADVQPNAEQSCPPEKGIHWIENCKSLLESMNSSDLCARHDAIDKCLEKVTCDNIMFAKLMRQVYTDGRPHLQCNERRA